MQKILRSSRMVFGAAVLMLAGLGCTPPMATASVGSAEARAKIAPRLQRAAEELESGAAQAPLTGLVRSDAAGNIQVYVHVTDTSAEHLKMLGANGLQNMLASPALRIVQGWIRPNNLMVIAALPFVTRVTPPQYAIPR